MRKVFLAALIVVLAVLGLSAPAAASVPHGSPIFSETFPGTALDTNRWVTYVGAQGQRWSNFGELPLPYSGPNQPGATGQAIYDPAQLTVNNGLTIHAKRNTGNFSGEYAWRSDTINSMTKVSLPDTGWFAVMRAKMPDMSHGMWPAFWFLPDQPGESVPEIDAFEGGFHELPGAPANRTTHFDYQAFTGGERASEQDIGTDMSKGYHYYGVKYLPGKSVTFYFDGVQKFQVTQAQAPILTGTYELMVNMQVAAAQDSGWHTVPTATSGDGGGMRVASVKVYHP